MGVPQPATDACCATGRLVNRRVGAYPRHLLTSPLARSCDDTVFIFVSCKLTYSTISFLVIPSSLALRCKW